MPRIFPRIAVFLRPNARNGPARRQPNIKPRTQQSFARAMLPPPYQLSYVATTTALSLNPAKLRPTRRVPAALVAYIIQ